MGYAFAPIFKKPRRMGFYRIFIKILPEWGVYVIDGKWF
jgi:hypothetical protein